MDDKTELGDIIGVIGIHQPTLFERIEAEIFKNLDDVSNRQYVKNLIEVDVVKKIVSTTIKNMFKKMEERLNDRL